MLLGPLVWSWIGLARPGPGAPSGGGRPTAGSGAMTRPEALEVLGLSSSASKSDIQAAYLRLMRAAHPDRGGSDWIAARINQARDVLLG
jgi:hypothetical protein